MVTGTLEAWLSIDPLCGGARAQYLTNLVPPRTHELEALEQANAISRIF